MRTRSRSGSPTRTGCSACAHVSSAAPRRSPPSSPARRFPLAELPGDERLPERSSRGRAQGGAPDPAERRASASRRRRKASARQPRGCIAARAEFEPAEVAARARGGPPRARSPRLRRGQRRRPGAITCPKRLSLAGDALAAGLDQARGAEEVVRVAARAAGAEAALLWAVGEDGALELARDGGPDRRRWPPLPRRPASCRTSAEPVRLEALTRRVAAERWRRCGLGQPPLGVARSSVFAAGVSPSQGELDRLGDLLRPRGAGAARRRARARRRRSSSSTLRPCSRSSARRSPSSRWRTR